MELIPGRASRPDDAVASDSIGLLRRVGIALSCLILGPLFLVGLVFFALIAPFTVIPHALEKRRLLRWFRQTHAREGRFVLFMTSDSPHWHDYIETRVLPRLEPHVVVMNWSRRAEWRTAKPPEARMLEIWGGPAAFNPLAMVIPDEGKPEVIRLWKPFRDLKHGKPQALDAALARLYHVAERRSA
ncbi:MAG TPA: hypothetical protein VF039_05455 [Longimicrobiales bacterium]